MSNSPLAAVERGLDALCQPGRTTTQLQLAADIIAAIELAGFVIVPTELTLTLTVIEAAIERSIWQPIETAPKDEEIYLLACCAGTKIPGIIGWDHDEWYWLNGMFHQPCKPTHWMPLPAPPQVDLPGCDDAR